MTALDSLPSLDSYVRDFETERRRGVVALGQFAPPDDHPERLAILAELIRVDMEYGWGESAPRQLEQYLREFPDLESDEAHLGEVASEEYRLRRGRGEAVLPSEYATRFGVDVREWADDVEEPPATQIVQCASKYLSNAPMAGDAAGACIREMSRRDAGQARRFAKAVLEFPAVGSDFAGFTLASELGRGAFARVYLAHQIELARRPIALKISAEVRSESHTLAQLQHQNIVPIYSMHESGLLQAVCMPYFGATTLADVVKSLRGQAVPPESGSHLLSTLNARKASTLGPDAQSEVYDPAPFAPSQAILSRFQKSSYSEAILWLGGRIAEGLTHAHARGVVHRDLKPANVLLTDDGQPMLLDFNLADDGSRGPAGARVGGTLPYMAPEQLAAFGRMSDAEVDGRSDIYALGLILYELLTGRLPFSMPTGDMSRVLAAMIEQREGEAAPLRRLNPDIAPGIQSIVAHCLSANPAERYQRADDLREDIDRHLADRPLAFAPNTSVRERWSKWSRRHPRLSSTAVLGSTAAAAIISLGVAYEARGASLARFEAAQGWQAFQQGRNTREAALGVGMVDRPRLPLALAESRAALAPFGVLQDNEWTRRPAFANLPPAEQAEARKQIGQLLSLTARGTSLQNENAEARRLADLAAQTLGDAEEDAYLLAVQANSEGRYQDALPRARQAVDADPSSLPAQFTLGLSQAGVGADAAAEAAFNACIALAPNHYWAHFNRGLMRHRQQNFVGAREAFDRCIALNPDESDAYLNRSLARRELGDLAGALADLTLVIDRGGAPTRLYFLRARVHRQLKNAVQAEADVAQGLKLQPADEASWVARGFERIQRDPEGALKDFEEALAINPKSRAAMQSKASVLSEQLRRTDDALRMLDRLIELYPESIPARGGRGVLLARLGRRDAAIADARGCLKRDRSPSTLYQVAGIYALLSKAHPAERLEALQLLTAALRGGFGWQHVNSDSDLDPIRNDPEFLKILATGR